MFDDLLKFTESANIAEDLGDDLLKTIGQDVVSNYDIDLSTMDDWRKGNDSNMRLASQVRESKNYPWPDSSNIKYPLLTEACIQFASRMYPELVKGDDIVASKVIGEDPDGAKFEQAKRVSQHMSWQLLEQQTEWEEDMDKLLTTMPIIGCMFKKSYFDPIIGRNRAELVYPKDLVVDYYTKSLQDATRVSHRLEKNKNWARKMQLNGVFLNLDLGEPSLILEKNDSGTDPKVSGRMERYDEDATPFLFIEQYCYLDLDDDGFDEPYIVTVRYDTGEVFRIVTCYEAQDISQDDIGNVLDVRQTQYFTKYGFMPAFDGSFYDIGFGQVLGPINAAVDTNINQLIDAAHFSTLQAGFIGRGFRAKKGDVRFRPGEWKQTDSVGGDMRNNILPLPTRDPSSVLFSLLTLMIDSGQRLASTIDSMVGENPGQNQKATTTMAVLDQGSKIFGGIYKRCHRALAEEFEKQFRLNSIYLEDGEYFNVLGGPPMEPAKQVEIRKSDYNLKSMNIVPTADKSYSSQQLKMAKAQGVLELTQTGYVNPEEATRNLLEAQEQPNIDVLMNMPPPQPSIEQQRLELDKQVATFNAMMQEQEFELKILELEMSDITIQTNAILALAKAEAEEEGVQMQLYKDELQHQREMSKEVTERMKLKQQEMAAKKAESEKAATQQ